MLEDVIRIFEEYTNKFDMTNKKIKHKHFHTYRVVDEMEDLIKSLDMNDEDMELALVIALLHDLGRFRQLELTDSYSDSNVNHAELSLEVLDNYPGFLDIKIMKDNEKLIKIAIANHNRLLIEDGLNERELFFCKLIRDADKLDIIYAMSKGMIEIKAVDDSITDKVFDRILKKQLVIREDMKSHLDEIVCDLSMIFDLNFDHSIHKVMMGDYVNQIVDKTMLTNEKEVNNLERIRNLVNGYMREHS